MKKYKITAVIEEPSDDGSPIPQEEIVAIVKSNLLEDGIEVASCVIEEVTGAD